MQPKKPDYILLSILLFLFSLLVYAGYLSYKSIDFDVLRRLEKIPLVLPTPIIATPVASPSASP